MALQSQQHMASLEGSTQNRKKTKQVSLLSPSLPPSSSTPLLQTTWPQALKVTQAWTKCYWPQNTMVMGKVPRLDILWYDALKSSEWGALYFLNVIIWRKKKRNKPDVSGHERLILSWTESLLTKVWSQLFRWLLAYACIARSDKHDKNHPKCNTIAISGVFHTVMQMREKWHQSTPLPWEVYGMQAEEWRSPLKITERESGVSQAETTAFHLCCLFTHRCGWHEVHNQMTELSEGHVMLKSVQLWTLFLSVEDIWKKQKQKNKLSTRKVFLLDLKKRASAYLVCDGSIAHRPHLKTNTHNSRQGN